jgi:choline dehydrogenase-like flavoprotein
MGMPSYGFGYDVDAMNSYIGGNGGGYGDKLREDVKRFYGSVLGMSGRGEAIARFENRCEIDPNVVDRYGIPVLRFDYKWSDYERLQAKHMIETFEEITHNMGGVVLGNKPGEDQEYGLKAPGEIIHEVGTTRMGDDPNTSVTNKWQQLHDAKNVFVVDGGPFTSQADKNCTWTIMALSMRASENIVNELKKMNI